MVVFVALVVCVALLIGMAAVVSRRRKRGTGLSADGRVAAGVDPYSNQWKYKAQMGGGGGHQGDNLPYS
ncbi:hypothetical protein G4Z16_13120 [Streptomyces bathyalis]|uniref:Uncharacterized protein n=1 Tax=Streptomyces bathyalis TaxID=2710756 RepID=A0A7T1T683_9ACTN|nr:hypothetical protein [Streptomyces bathyalis]QPP07168.1 hypothetical protein G4Z16_13120 [Streptomyces bathyalis]